MALRLAGERYPSEGVFDTVTITDGAGHYLQLPKLTTAQRDALSAEEGMVIYNSTTNQLERYQAGAWAGLGGVSDHGQLDGLGDDDHTQYLNTARHDITDRHPLGSVVPHDDHGALSGLGDDDHSQYFLANGSREASKVVITDGAGHYLQVPKLTTTQRDALTAVNGMLVYNSTTNQFERYQNGAWGAFGGGGQQYVFYFNIEPQVSNTISTTDYAWTPYRCWKSYHNLGDIFSGKTITAAKVYWNFRIKTNNSSYAVYAKLRVSLKDPASWTTTPEQSTTSTDYVVKRGSMDFPIADIVNGKAEVQGVYRSAGGSATAYQYIETVMLVITVS